MKIQKKICMLGAFAVGKTSLVQRYVKSIFSDKYQTTLGVKVDKKIMSVRDQEMSLMIWDLAGEDEFMKVKMSYLRGSSGFLFVVDGTRRETLDTALRLQEKIQSEMGEIPQIMLINKSDVESEWEIDKNTIADLTDKGWLIFKTSAKNGELVEDAFQDLANQMLGA